MLRSESEKDLLLLLALSCSLFFANILFAGEQELLKASNDEDKRTFSLILITDDHEDIVSMRQDTYLKNGKLDNSITHKMQDLLAKGLLLKKQGDHEVVRLKSDNFAAHNGGDVELDTLYSGVSGKRKSYHFELLRNGDVWSLERNSRPVKKLHFKSNKVFLIGTVGIEAVKTRGFSTIKP